MRSILIIIIINICESLFSCLVSTYLFNYFQNNFIVNLPFVLDLTEDSKDASNSICLSILKKEKVNCSIKLLFIKKRLDNSTKKIKYLTSFRENIRMY